jgi:hypothetical protein
LKACPSAAARQLALLHVLAGDVLAAAELLVQAPGAGWSGDEHPGPLLFAFFIERLGGARKLTWTGIDAAVTDGFEALLDDHDGPRLASPRISEIIARVGGVTMGSPDERRIVLEAMKQAAEKRIASVTADKHRSRYAQAAGLVAGCVACDESGESARWAMGIKLEYRRFPSFRQALENALGAS